MTDVGELVDEAALATFCREALGGAPDAALGVERHGEGFSNETLLVEWDDRALVLRRPPAGDHAEGAHDVLREARVVDAVSGEVPVPEIAATCDDTDVIGSPFVLMERLDGDVLRAEEPDRFATAAHRRAVGERLVETLADVHAVDYEAIGLEAGTFGYPDGYLERQVENFTEQLEWLLPTTEQDREVPHLREVGDWLAENLPEESDHTLVHGDYKLDNLMFESGTPPTVAGVLDWELSTLGDPLADLGWMLVFWREPHDPDPGLPGRFLPRFMEHEDYPTRTELVARYEDRTGRAFTDERFYRGLAAYKIATTAEAMYYRYREGDADDPLYPALEEGVPELARRAKRIVDGEEPL
ncbi:phosphotransferase family protein [Salinirubellus salinus]|uniref:Phosphotransferase family protein n=1 Tax=Salinirubellus salinus TaxID=1364945 RepID=A0A9E7R271_9EURY|nr:phosphotransferase family protein [Salinirubellus salinus]UWM53483.1 phosphotransferase family protein [Salinirubellus salinus]